MENVLHLVSEASKCFESLHLHDETDQQQSCCEHPSLHIDVKSKQFDIARSHLAERNNFVVPQKSAK